MSTLTAALYGALIVYLGGWFLGHWTGNFSLLLFVMTMATLLFWLAERYYFAPRRAAEAQAIETHDAARAAELRAKGITQVDSHAEEQRAQALAQPWWLDWTAGLFPVILIVFLLRSFLFEPFKIPSGSMIPTLLIGDLILVNKFHYGVRLPVINKKIIDNHSPARGDVIVFRYPPDPRQDYIKRVVGLPGDEVVYANQKLTINGQLVATTAMGEYYDDDTLRYTPQFSEKLGEREHRMLVDPRRNLSFGADQKSFPFAQNCKYSVEAIRCKVPAGHYFMMGDNSDNSLDSRAWGFVPEENLVGRAFFIWMNFGNLGRIGSFH